jgi:hypothetical protein
MSRFTNTTGSQNRKINAARLTNHIVNLIAIIEDLDNQLTEWKKAADNGAGCDTPDELRTLLTIYTD